MKKLLVKKPRDFEMLSDLKIRIKKLEAEAKELQTELLVSSKEKNIIVPKGVFSRQIRESYKVTNMPFIFGNIGEEDFLANCSFSKTAIIKTGGQKGFDYFLQEDAVKLSSTSEYFRFTVNKS